MTWSDHKLEIAFIVDLLVFTGFALMYLYFQEVFWLFVWMFSLIIMKFFALRGWQRSIKLTESMNRGFNTIIIDTHSGNNKERQTLVRRFYHD